LHLPLYQSHFFPTSDLFSIIKSADALERLFVRDMIPAPEYERECDKLIGQFRTLWSTLRVDGGLGGFARQYALDCPLGLKRLETGMSAVREHGAGPAPQDVRLFVAVHDVTSSLITARDALELGLVQVVDLKPQLEALYQHMLRVSALPPNFEGRDRVRQWISRMNMLAAADRLADDEIKALKLDLDSVSIQFRSLLEGAT
jgi:ESCRT-I complex subunit VPS28